MPSVPHVTLREIAAAARVHLSTVSLALRDDPRLRHSTRQHIQQIALRLGYAADALTGSLSKYRRSSRRETERPRIAWITHHPTATGWRKLATARQAFLGAQECADALGYALQPFWIGGKSMTVARVTRRLQTLGAIGLLIAPAVKPTRKLKLPWDLFPAVAIGLSLASPVLHLTANHHFRSAKLAVQQLVRLGYRRIGLVLRERANLRVERSWLGGYLVTVMETGEKEFPRPLILRRWDAPRIRRWYRREKPDAIITRHPELLQTLERMGVAVPGDVGLALLSVPDRSGTLAGIDENARAVGAGAMARVANMITWGERGVPLFPQRLLFEGTWVDGRTVRLSSNV